MIDDRHHPASPGAPTAAPTAAASSDAAPRDASPHPDAPAAPEAEPQTPAHARFQSCRWRKPADAGVAAYCTHRDVLPMAGTNGFNPESWCPDCAFYKLRRVPRREY